MDKNNTSTTDTTTKMTNNTVDAPMGVVAQHARDAGFNVRYADGYDKHSRPARYRIEMLVGAKDVHFIGTAREVRTYVRGYEMGLAAAHPINRRPSVLPTRRTNLGLGVVLRGVPFR